ncbi:hypothetical protein [Methylobacterium gregans]|uniref:Transposase IS116/IS110/IS902 family protein n=1 Tax=Methylobacterium gregans TaxID=374424 RepID=A0AA37MAW6_9HYPH|nr:hypothetical protein [Methylobacterium gregans]MDQ0523609.1 transposase [Methylobacterium gregans]GJD78258.1 hypothetical protein NBEOAGPD_1472 [Methylobacterium gregans]GLS55523.1 hypothetical protein GCM10007886_37080 [Methylobacterium gregans]
MAIKAGCGVDPWGRTLAAHGRTVRMMSPAYARNNVKADRTDDHDIDAIAEAGAHPMMRFVAIAFEAQVDVQTLDRVRHQFAGDARR